MSYLKSFCLVLLLPAVLYGSTVVINEFMALNDRSERDPQNQYDDWIELYNTTDVPIDAGGLYLTDDLAEPNKWQIPTEDPAATTIAPRGHLLIWADGDTQDAGLHASFGLSGIGEEIGLFDTDGVTLLDSVTFGPQSTDISYGRYPDGADDWHFAGYASPGFPNRRVYADVVSPVEFSQERGFCDQPFEVTLSCETPGAAIYYTTNGDEPYDQSGRFATGARYTEPILIDKTTCLRARAVKAEWMSSRIRTNTYVFVQDVITQSPSGQPPTPTWPSSGANGQRLDYGVDPAVVDDPRYADLIDDALLAIPSISLVTDLDNLFDSATGIYVHASAEGSAWERPVSVELIHPDGTEGFQLDAGLRIRGGFSRSGSNPKHAFRLFFRSEYGGALEYALFGEEGADWFENVDLRTSQNYSWSYQGDSQNSMVREVFSRDVQGRMGQPYTRSRYYHLYINGQYWGLYQTQERSEASYAASYFDGNKTDFDVVKMDREQGDMMQATDGNMEAYRRLYDAAMEGFIDDEQYYRIQGLNPDGTPNADYERLLDVDNLIDFMIIEYYTGDRDGPGSRFGNRPNNTYAIFDRERPDGWKWFQHDSEHTLGVSQSELNLVSPLTTAGVQWRYFNPHWLHEQLAQRNATYRMRFADRVYRHLFNDGVLTPQAAAEGIMERAHQIEMAIIAESARWGDSLRSPPLTKQHWENEIDRLLNGYLPTRASVVLGQLLSVGWYPPIDPPVFNVNGVFQHGGHAAAGDEITLAGGAGTLWYTLDGSDPWTPGAVGGVSGEVTLVPEDAPKRVLVPTGAVSDAWRGGDSFDDRSWISGTGGVGYERSTGYEQFFDVDVQNQMYGRNATCYIRIPFDLTAESAGALTSLTLRIRYDDGFVAYLNGAEVLRVSFGGTPLWNSSATMSHSDIDAISPETFDISAHVDLVRGGENILAIQGLNESAISSDFLITVEMVAVEEAGAVTPNGDAPTAFLYTGPVTLNSSTHVKVRSLNGSTWSALNEATFAVGPVAESLRISEIMYHPIETGNPDDPNAEYIELTNVGIETIDLNLVRLANGVEFTFPSIELPPGSYIVVVRDIGAFQARYGTDVPVAGQYAGRLNNAGERVGLQDAAGRVIHNFRYRDDWYDLTDGLGFSLTIRDPVSADPNTYDEKAVWQPSVDAGGSPGYDDRDAMK